jgi:hypothetical protein
MMFVRPWIRRDAESDPRDAGATRASLHQHQHGGLLHGLHHVLELAGLGARLLELGGDLGDRMQESEEVAALLGVALGGTRVSRVVSGVPPETRAGGVWAETITP